MIGENEEETPWTPLQVERGFKKEDNTLTVFFPNNFLQSVPMDTSAEGLAQSLANLQPWNMSCLIVIPSHAKILADAGWTKEKLKKFILENAPARGPARKEGADVLSQPPRAIDPSGLMVLVAGGPGAWMAALRSVGGIQNDFVTKKIELPRNWDKLVAKYKDVVPVYVPY